MELRSKKFRFLLLAFYFALTFVLQGCSTSSDTQTNDTGNSKDDDKTFIQKAQSGSIQDNALSSGGCPRVLHCGAVGRCGLYIDQNNNQFCDRGEITTD